MPNARRPDAHTHGPDQGDSMTTTTTTRTLCRGCGARHHERCTGWTDTYRTLDNGALALMRCECARCTDA